MFSNQWCLARILFWCLFLVGFGPCRTLHAQIQNGDITGVVSDPSGAVLTNTRVNLKNFASGWESFVETNEQGIYFAKALIPGSYTISVNKAGFQPESVDIKLHGGSVTRVDIRLSLAQRVETLSVEDNSHGVNL